MCDSKRFLPVLFASILVLGPARSACAQNTVTALFSHVAIGGGFTTTFTLLNTGSSVLTGTLYLTAQDGTPLTAAFTGPAGFQANAASVPLNIPIGGTQFWTASAPGAGDPQKAGWARVESSGGTLGGVATFQLTSGGILQTIAGVLSSHAVQFATIPVDDNLDENRYTGYAVANPGTDTLSIKVQTVNADGSPGPTLTAIPLAPGRQIATFLFQDQAAARHFQGTVVLIGQNGSHFSVVALVQNQGLYTAIPVIPAKAPAIN
jgi:hypothetical protein